MIEDEEREPDAEHALRVLQRRPPATLDWRPPDVVRRIVVRRRWRRGIGAAVVLAAAISGAVSLTNQTSSTRQLPQTVATGPTRVANRLGGAVQLVADTRSSADTDARAAARVSAAEQALSVALLKQLSGSANSAVSPLSLYVALGMLQNGAAGETATQIAHALQASSLSTGEQDAGLATLSSELNAAAAQDGITLQSANSLWQQKGFPLRPEFLADLATYFKSGVWQVDFQHDMPAALQAMNAWTAQQTHGKITKLFDDLDPSTVLVLANAVYFHAAWLLPFDPKATEPGQFTTATGAPVTVKYMSGGPVLATANDDYSAVQLPYTGNRFAALVVMPRRDSLTQFVDSLTPKRLDTIAAGLLPGMDVALPRFTTTPTIDLIPILQSLGMRDAFDHADFSALSSEPTDVGRAIQRVYLTVGEHGTTAAAVTGIAMDVSAISNPPPPIIKFDHPFLFLVRDTKTGAILFAAQITDPTAG